MSDSALNALNTAATALIDALKLVDNAREQLRGLPIGNLKPAPLFLHDTNAAALLTGSAGLCMTHVPIADTKLVDQPRPSEATAIVDWPDAPLPDDSEAADARAFADRSLDGGADAQFRFIPATEESPAAAPNAPRLGGARKIEIDPQAWQHLLDIYNGSDQPPLHEAYDRWVQLAGGADAPIPSRQTVIRRMREQGLMRPRGRRADPITESTPASFHTADRAGGCNGQAPEGTSGYAAGGALQEPANVCPPHIVTDNGQQFPADAFVELPNPMRPSLKPASERRRVSDALHYQAKTREARELEEPVDERLRPVTAAHRPAHRASDDTAPQPMLGARTNAQPPKLPPLPFEERKRQLDAAIKFLASKGILVSVADRDAQIRTYRVTGRRESQYAEDVIAMASERGFSPAGAASHD